MDPVLQPFLQWGPPGAIIIALATATVALWKRNSVIQDNRINEANERTRMISEVAKEVAVAINSLSAAIATIKEMITRLDR